MSGKPIPPIDGRRVGSRATVVAAALFGCFIAAVIVSANTGMDHPGRTLVEVLPYGDKIGHVVLWGLMAFLANLAIGHRRLGPLGTERIPFGTAVVGIVLVVEEFSQHFVASRTLDAVDLLADAVGLVLATVAYRRLTR